MAASTMAASAGAVSRRQVFSPRGSRAKNAITATEVAASSMMMPSPPVVPPQKNSRAIGFWCVSAQAAMTTSPVRALRQRGGFGDVVAPGPAQRGGQHVLPAQGKRVAPHGVVERQRGGEQRGHEQHLRGLAERSVAGQAEQQPRALRRGGSDHVAGAGVGGHRPRRPGVDDGDQAQRGVGRGRDRAPGHTRLLAQHRRLLKPHEPQHGDHRQHAERAEPGRPQRPRGQRRERQVPARRVRQPEHGLGHDHADLGRSTARPAPGR